MRSLCITFLASLLLLSACFGSDDSEPTVTGQPASSPTPVLEATATPEPTIAPSPSPAPDPVGPIVALLAGNAQSRLMLYDTGIEQMLADVALPPADGYYRGDARAGLILVADDAAVSKVRLDGSLDTIFELNDDDHQVTDVAISPDGATAAVAVMYWPRPDATPVPDGNDYVLFVDIATRDVQLRIDRSAHSHPGGSLADFRGRFHWLVWRDDGAGVVVSGATFTEGAGSWATLYLDGSVVRHGLVGYASVSSNGRLVTHGEVTVRCMAVASDRIEVRDLPTDMDVLSVQADEGHLITAWDWSPDSSELLIARSPLIQSNDEALGPGPCPDFDSRSWLMLDITTGATQPIDDLDALYQRWNAAEPLITMDCAGRTQYPTYTRWAERYISCFRYPDGGPLFFNGDKIAEGTQFQVLGIIAMQP